MYRLIIFINSLFISGMLFSIDGKTEYNKYVEELLKNVAKGFSENSYYNFSYLEDGGFPFSDENYFCAFREESSDDNIKNLVKIHTYQKGVKSFSIKKDEQFIDPQYLLDNVVSISKFKLDNEENAKDKRINMMPNELYSIILREEIPKPEIKNIKGRIKEFLHARDKYHTIHILYSKEKGVFYLANHTTIDSIKPWRDVMMFIDSNYPGVSESDSKTYASSTVSRELNRNYIGEFRDKDNLPNIKDLTEFEFNFADKNAPIEKQSIAKYRLVEKIL